MLPSINRNFGRATRCSYQRRFTTTINMQMNSAAWIEGPKANPLVVREAPYPTTGPQDAIVKVIAIAVNPLEYKIQDYNPPIGGKALRYPTILGADLAGVVVEAGAECSYKVSDRLITNSSGALAGDITKSAFQHYAKISSGTATPVPDSIPLTDAVVLPLACDTAMAGLFMEDQLALSTAHLLEPATAPSSSEAILIWGGSSSVGCCAIQLARAAGYDIYTTASARNHGLVTSIGAAHVVDHACGDVEEALITALQGKTVVGALDCISSEQTVAACARVLAASTGPKRSSCVLTPPPMTEGGLAGDLIASRRKLQFLPRRRYGSSESNANDHSKHPRDATDRPLRPPARLANERAGDRSPHTSAAS